MIFKRTLETIDREVNRIREEQRELSSDKEMADNMFSKLNENLLEKLEFYREKITSKHKF
jgi:CHASE3 domain sensor protein